MKYFIVELLLMFTIVGRYENNAMTSDCKPKDETFSPVVISALSVKYKSGVIYYVSDFSDIAFVHGIKWMQLPCASRKKEYMVVGYLKQFQKTGDRIDRGENALIWVALFHKGHSLGSSGGQKNELSIDLFNARRMLNNLNRKEEVFSYNFPLVNYNVRCIPHLVEFVFFELKDNITGNDVTVRSDCTEEYRTFKTDFPIKRVSEITKEKIGKVSFMYCRTSFPPNEEIIKNNLKDVLAFMAMCELNPKLI